MSPPNISKLPSASLLVVAAALLSLSASAMPIIPREPTPPSELPSPDPSHMSRKVVFDIIFGLVLFFITIVACACVASQGAFTRFIGIIDRMCVASDALKQIVSSFRITTFFAWFSNALAGANDGSHGVSSTHNGSGEVRDLPTISRPAIPIPTPIPIPISAHNPDPQTGPTASV